MRVTIQALQKMKAEGRKIAMVTAYDFTSAQAVERAGLPVILVGDSLGMVVYGHDTTLQVTLADMVRHAGAVVRGSTRPLVIGDLPFLASATVERAIDAAGRLMSEAGVQAVKLEGAAPVTLAAIRTLVDLGIPVMGHVGYTPQSTHQIGLRMQGKSEDEASRVRREALAIEAAGAFGIVLELVPDALAAEITAALAIPTIGIGAGPDCDGQVQVWHDILGLYGEQPPRHAKRYAMLTETATSALADYADEVGRGQFPPARRPAA